MIFRAQTGETLECDDNGLANETSVGHASGRTRVVD
jgi:hypothetical protein